MRHLSTAAIAGVLALSGCGPKYALVPAAPVTVAKGMTVDPGIAWNRSPKGRFDVDREERWTANGPLLDSIGFVAGLPDGQAIVRQRRKEDWKVPVFRADMSPQDLVSMMESFYRIRAGATIFTADAVVPATFLGRPALQFDYSYVGADEVKRRGRAVMAVVDRRLYLASLDAAALHYFDAALPQFTVIAGSARIG